MKQLFFLFVWLNIGFFAWEYQLKTWIFPQPKALTTQPEHQLWLVSELEQTKPELTPVVETETVDEPITTAPEPEKELDEPIIPPNTEVKIEVLEEPELVFVKVDEPKSIKQAEAKIEPVKPLESETKPVVTTPPKTEEIIETVFEAESRQEETITAPPVVQETLAVKELCYQMTNITQSKAAELWATEQALKQFKIEESHKGLVSAWIVYFPAGKDYAQSQKNILWLKERGVNDVWLFKQGEFKGQISLGMFQIKAGAVKAQQQFKAKGVTTKLRPRYKRKPLFSARFYSDKNLSELKTRLGKLKKCGD